MVLEKDTKTLKQSPSQEFGKQSNHNTRYDTTRRSKLHNEFFDKVNAEGKTLESPAKESVKKSGKKGKRSSNKKKENDENTELPATESLEPFQCVNIANQDDHSFDLEKFDSFNLQMGVRNLDEDTLLNDSNVSKRLNFLTCNTNEDSSILQNRVNTSHISNGKKNIESGQRHKIVQKALKTQAIVRSQARK